jgi:natural product precursor
MLKLKNAQSLSRTDMKNLMGGMNDNAARPYCTDACMTDMHTGEHYCPGDMYCQIYVCYAGVPTTYSYKCV